MEITETVEEGRKADEDIKECKKECKKVAPLTRGSLLTSMQGMPLDVSKGSTPSNLREVHLI
eukprot:5828229-Pyramimonas_sp.AAC.3